MRLFLYFAALALGICPNLALANDEPEFDHLRQGGEVILRPDTAYLLLRIPSDSVRLMPAFLRKPTAAEMNAWREARQIAFENAGGEGQAIDDFAFEFDGLGNLHQVNYSRYFAKTKALRTFLIAVKPADYVFYGVGRNNYLYQCNCFGTVSFVAKAGTVTDLGTILVAEASKPSSHPELAQDTNMGRKMRTDFRMMGVAVRPATAATSVPADAASLPREYAHYHAEGSFHDINRDLANRLAPMPGVLEYRDGLAFDTRTGEILH